MEYTGIIKKTTHGRCYLIMYENGSRKIFSISRRLPVQSGGAVKIRGKIFNNVLNPEHVEIILFPYKNRIPNHETDPGRNLYSSKTNSLTDHNRKGFMSKTSN